MIYIGNHLSASKGYLAMGKAAVALGGDTFAFFTRNPRGGKAKDIDKADVEAFLSFAKEHDFGPLVAHAPYTMNLCSDKENIRVFARDMFADDLKRMEYTPGNYYNFHPGSHVGQGVDAGIEMIISVLNDTLWQDMTTTVLLETMAGKGSEIGRDFAEIRRIIDGVALDEKVGVCLDTCHIWDGGYDIVGHLDEVLAEFDKVIGLERLRAIHLNDSMMPFGSRKDRHAVIGGGEIGIEALLNVMRHPKLKDLPFYLETPLDDAGHKEEIARLRDLA